MKKCKSTLHILCLNDSRDRLIDFQCELDENHKGIHKHYGDNYCLTWLKEEHMIQFPEVLTDELRERCRKMMCIDNLETAGDEISEII